MPSGGAPDWDAFDYETGEISRQDNAFGAGSSSNFYEFGKRQKWDTKHYDIIRSHDSSSNPDYVYEFRA